MTWMVTISYPRQESLRLLLTGRGQYDVIFCYITCSCVKCIAQNELKLTVIVFHATI